MGMFWDLIQQAELDKQQKQADTLEERVAWLEEELIETRKRLRLTLETLEKHVGKDLDGDGKVG